MECCFMSLPRGHIHTHRHIAKHCVNYLFTNRKPIEYDPLISCSFSCLSYLPASTWHPSTASFSSGGPPPPANEWDTCALAARRTRTTSACPRLAEICSGVFKMLMSSCQTITGTALQSPVPHQCFACGVHRSSRGRQRWHRFCPHTLWIGRSSHR